MPAPGPAAIREQLSQAFEPRQAQVLSDVLADAIALRERYVEEMSQVRQELVHLAEAQQRTERRLEQLAEAQQRTERRLEQLAEVTTETRRELALLARQVGGLSDKLGGSLEDLAHQTVPAVLGDA